MAAATAVFAPDKDRRGVKLHTIGDCFLLTGKITFAGDYAAGGIALDLRKYYRGKAPTNPTCVLVLGAIRGLTAEYDLTNRKLKLFGNTTAAATAEHTDATTIDTDITGSAVPVAFLIVP